MSTNTINAISYKFRLNQGKISKADIREALSCSRKVFSREMNDYMAADEEFRELYVPNIRKKNIVLPLAKLVIERLTGVGAEIEVLF